jgi:hypothetical protein
MQLIESARPRLWGLIALTFFSLWGTEAMAVEELAYTVVQEYDAFELRRYEPFVVAETTVKGDFEGVGGAAFGVLFDFIRGKNQGDRTIAMTAPVTQRAASEAEPTRADRHRVGFVMPSQYTMDSVPRPTDPRVELRSVPGRLVAVRQYSGRWTVENFRQNERILRRALKQQGLEPVEPRTAPVEAPARPEAASGASAAPETATATLAGPIYARYNSPFSLWFLRRNEVMIEVAIGERNPPSVSAESASKTLKENER